MKEENYGGDEEDTKRRARERSRNEDDPLTKSEGESENKEDDLREEEKRTERPEPMAAKLMGKVFRRPMTMRAYKYVNEVYYIPTRARVGAHYSKISLQTSEER